MSLECEWIDDARSVADAVRTIVLDHTIENRGGYLSQACSSAEMLAALYSGLMKLGDVENPILPEPFAGTPGPANREYVSGAATNGATAPHLDRFIFSPAHYALVLYAVLVQTGRLAPEALKSFNQDGSSVELIGAEHSPGFETTTGSLAQALSHAGGIALAQRLRGNPGHVWVFMSDGEFQEGQTWEAIASLAHHGLSNMTVLIDANGQQCDGAIESVMSVEPLGTRIAAFGGDVVEIDGNSMNAIVEAAQQERDGRPRFIIGRTDPTSGFEELLGPRAPALHYVRFTSDQEYARFCDFQAQRIRGSA